MTTTTTNQGLTLPTSGDLNGVSTHMALYNAGVENRLVQRYVNTTDRLTRNPTPTEGELSYLSTEDRYETYNGSSWVPLYAAGAWTSYTPTWGVVSGTVPNIGNGSIVGRYQQIGKTVHLAVKMTFGATTTFGSNQWTLTLPVSSLLTNAPQLIFGRIFDTSAPNAYMALAHLTDGTKMTLEAQGVGETDGMAQGNPITYAAGDFVHFQGTYEAA